MQLSLRNNVSSILTRMERSVRTGTTDSHFLEHDVSLLKNIHKQQVWLDAQGFVRVDQFLRRVRTDLYYKC